MTSMTTVPVTIAPETTAYVAAFGLQREFDQILEHILQTVSDLKRIEVTLDACPESDSPTEPAAMILVYSQREDPERRTQNALIRWMIATFPPDQRQNFVVWVTRETADEG